MIYRQSWGLAIISRNINIKLVVDTMINNLAESVIIHKLQNSL